MDKGNWRKDRVSDQGKWAEAWATARSNALPPQISVVALGFLGQLWIEMQPQDKPEFLFVLFFAAIVLALI